MVAYSFQPFFAPQVEALTKRQTIRPERKRHARPGEPVQLFTGMRTKWCRKLVPIDPICSSAARVEIVVTDLISELIASIEIDGISLSRDQIEAFARADGFAPEKLRDNWPVADTARETMGLFWRDHHGFGRFEGVLVKWEPA